METKNPNKDIKNAIYNVINYNNDQTFKSMSFDWQMRKISRKDFFAFDMTEEEVKQFIKTQKLAHLAAQYNQDVRKLQSDEVGLGTAARRLLSQVEKRKEDFLRQDKQAEQIKLKKAEQKLKEKNIETMTQAKILKVAKLISSFTPAQKKLFAGLNIQ